ncbi:hypothetical protein J7L48_00075 [bacterium]|nr:hypothetical protein [bacterium]
MNIVLCIIIVALGFMKYGKEKKFMPLLIAIAFGLFGLSHLATFFGIAASLEIVLIVVRTIAYLLVVFALITKK